MLQANLPDFLATLRRERDVVEVRAPVDPHLELAEIHLQMGMPAEARVLLNEGG